ncbi:peroxiredoxin family protein [Myxococcus sp. K15C18031901]|uniref:peroxiredoxin family protein n=1 Tax=Myxococcus dinghuensis TaxID=2906761 RepID=UPI0020A77AB9|nr:peroxiredoxin family protein [Myxococcus dinghuensis]MCP3103706.1 peroxiredoxin family protein [Myxococcus dinghuensis]
MRTWIKQALSLSLVAGSTFASAPHQGPMDATLRTSTGDEVRLSRWRGKPVILFYEDKDSTTLNAGLKEDLFARGKERNLLGSAFVVAVANLQKFDFFPARQIALSYVRDEEKKVGVPILVDLKGTLGEPPWELPTKTSNVLLLDAGGAVVYRHSGRMKPEEQTAFFAALSQLVGVDLRTPVEPAPGAPQEGAR